MENQISQCLKESNIIVQVSVGEIKTVQQQAKPKFIWESKLPCFVKM